MVVFNPQIQPLNVPNWERTSQDVRPVPYEADKSAGLALGTAATGIEEGAKVAERTMEDYLKDKVSAGVNTLRDTSLLAYQDIRNSQITGTQASPAATQTAGFNQKSLLANNTDIPEDLQAGLDRASNIGLARSQRGAANDTLYTSQLYALTKQLRSEYPGHRDFIDEQIAKVSGKNPANAYMDNLLSDINRASTGQDVFQKMVMTKAAANMGDADVQKGLLAVQHNVPNAMSLLTKYVFSAEGRKAEHEQWRIENEETKGNQAADATKATGQYESRAQKTIDMHINPVVDIPGLTDPVTMRKLVDDSISGKVSLSTTQKDMLVQTLAAARAHAADDLDRVADQEGYSRRIRSPDVIKNIRDSKLAYFDRSIALLNDEKYGSFFEGQRRSKGMQDTTNLQINTSPIGEWTRQRSFMNEKLGPNWMNYLDSIGLQKGNLQQLQSFFNDTQFNASHTQDVRNPNVVHSMYEDLVTARKAKEAGAKAPDKIYDDLTDNVKLIQKAVEQGKEDVAKEVVKYTFDPAKNQRIVEFFGKDFTDSKGVRHNGREAIYDTLTQPKTVDAIWNLKDPASWQMHKEWQEISFKTIFDDEIKVLNRQMNWKQTDSKLNWDSDNSRFFLSGPSVDKSRKFDPNVPAVALPNDVANVRIAEGTLTTLNRGLKNLSYMHNKEGGDTNSYLWNMLTTEGFSPNDRLRGDNLPQRIIEAVAASSKSNKKRIEDAFKASSGE